jgi:hypothetical protein
MQKLIISGLSLAVATLALAGGASAECFISGRPVPPSTTPPSYAGAVWPSAVVRGAVNDLSGLPCVAGDDVVLGGRIFVATDPAGTDNGVVSIVPGTIVRGTTRVHLASLAAVPSTLGVPGALIVTQSGQIESDGDSDSPVIFTTAAVDNDMDGVPDDMNGDGFLDHWPGFAGPCACTDQAGDNAAAPFGTVACLGPDQLPGTADDTIGDPTVETFPGGPALNGCVWQDGDANSFPGGIGDANGDGQPDGNGVAAHFYDDTPATNPLSPMNPVTHEENVSLWGGLVILGNAPLNFAGSTLGIEDGQGLVEGITIPGEPVEFATCGGVSVIDNSGFVEFTEVRHAGDELSQNNELNGFTLCGVGTGTRFEFNSVYTNFDDGIEFFGGTVLTNNLNMSLVGDDSFDIDWGHTGHHQFWTYQQPWFNEYSDGSAYGSESGDNGGEWDGDDFDEAGGAANVVVCGPVSDSSLPGARVGIAPCPMASMVVYNLTGMGNALDTFDANGAPVAAEYDPNTAECDGDPTTVSAGEPGCCNGGAETCTGSDNDGIYMRNGFAGELRNSLILNAGNALGYRVECLADGDPGSPGFDVCESICSWDHQNDGLLGPVRDAGYGSMVRLISVTNADSGAIPGYPDAGPPALPAPLGCTGTAAQAVVNGDMYARSILGEPASRRSCVDDGTGTLRRIDGSAAPPFAGLVNEDISFDPEGQAKGGKLKDLATATISVKATPINPLIQSAGGCATVATEVSHPVQGRTTIGGPRNGQDTVIRGAFSDSNWADGWTALGIGDVF